MTGADWPRVAAIYRAGMESGNATFETAVPSWEDWDAAHLATPRLVADAAGEVAGWAALSAYADRCVYGGVADVSVYVATAARGRGLGRVLLDGLVAGSEESGIWTLQAGVFPENEASLILHERAGFRRVGVRERIGKMGGRWRDVVLLERRSDVAGVDR
ncbi:MAG: N-acetyltransferase family protein [Gemmatimonadota bacterium]